MEKDKNREYSYTQMNNDEEKSRSGTAGGSSQKRTRSRRPGKHSEKSKGGGLFSRRKRKKRKPEEPERTAPGYEDRNEYRRKRRRIKKRRRRIVFIVILAALTLIGALAIVNKSGLANLETIVVEGNVHYSAKEIISEGKVHKGSGLIFMRTEKIRRNISEMPYIKSVVIDKQIPHTLKIDVKERKPVYSVYFGGFFLYLDSNLIAIDRANTAGSTIVIEGYSMKDYEIGKRFEPDDSAGFNSLLRLSEKISDTGLSVYKLSYLNSVMRVYMTKYIVCEGTYENISKYADRLDVIYKTLQEQDIQRATIHIGENGYISFSPKV